MIDDQTLDARFRTGGPAGHYNVTDAALDEVLLAVRAHSARRRRQAVVSVAGVGAALVIGAMALPAAADVVREFLSQQAVHPRTRVRKSCRTASGWTRERATSASKIKSPDNTLQDGRNIETHWVENLKTDQRLDCKTKTTLSRK